MVKTIGITSNLLKYEYGRKTKKTNKIGSVNNEFEIEMVEVLTRTMRRIMKLRIMKMKLTKWWEVMKTRPNQKIKHLINTYQELTH